MRRVVVTGGGSGIGAATAQRAKEDGFDVVTIDLNGGDFTADLSDEVQVRGALEAILREGPVYGLVNNVGSIQVDELEYLAIEDVEWSMRVNLHSTIVATQAVVPAMKAEGVGRIVNISSRAVLGKAGRTAYSASKAAVLGVTRTWALELGQYGITVNTVSPGPIQTPLFDRANPFDSPANSKNR